MTGHDLSGHQPRGSACPCDGDGQGQRDPCAATVSTAGQTWPLDPAPTESALEARLYPAVVRPDTPSLPDVQRMERELRRPHVTLELLWREFREAYAYQQQHLAIYLGNPPEFNTAAAGVGACPGNSMGFPEWR